MNNTSFLKRCKKRGTLKPYAYTILKQCCNCNSAHARLLPVTNNPFERLDVTVNWNSGGRDDSQMKLFVIFFHDFISLGTLKSFCCHSENFLRGLTGYRFNHPLSHYQHDVSSIKRIFSKTTCSNAKTRNGKCIHTGFVHVKRPTDDLLLSQI